ncbi:hypothetical protein A4A49_02045 [Nicotiana attenuata]|uniref:Uncharacterized protein n=1 Tax=Nicotiana attenuata TaxID=49451 RepID=A0A314L537_NICAT|nr:hypothetical protein A4A49_02045 [Nicotiana attenuata]
MEKFNVELVRANAGQKGDGEGISFGNRKEVQVLDLTTGNSQQEIAVDDVVGPVRSKFSADIPATTVFARMFEATVDALKVSADGQDRDMAASVGKINIQGEAMNQANIGNNQIKVAGAGHVGKAGSPDGDCQGPKAVNSAVTAKAVSMPGHVEGAEISPTGVGANFEGTTTLKTTFDRVVALVEPVEKSAVACAQFDIVTNVESGVQAASFDVAGDIELRTTAVDVSTAALVPAEVASKPIDAGQDTKEAGQHTIKDNWTKVFSKKGTPNSKKLLQIARDSPGARKSSNPFEALGNVNDDGEKNIQQVGQDLASTTRLSNSPGSEKQQQFTKNADGRSKIDFALVPVDEQMTGAVSNVALKVKF